MAQFIFPPLTASLDSEQTNGGSLPTKQMVIAGYDSTATRVLLTDSAGRLEINAVVSLPLPTGAATAALQTAGNNILTTIDVDTSILAAAVTASKVQTEVLSVIPGVGATNLGKAIQSAQGTTDTGVPALVVRNDTLADLSGADGDYAPIQVNADGAVYTTVSSGTINVGTVSGTVTVTGTALKLGTANAGVNIGTVALSTSTGVDIGNVGLKAGTNNIGDVDIASMPDVTVDTYTVVDQIDSTVSGVTNNVYVLSGTQTIPASTGTAMTLVATSAAAIKKIQTVEDIGEFMGIWYGSGTSTAGTATFGCVLPLGGGEVPLEIPSGYKIYLKTLTSGTALTSGNIGINFLG
jgi:hypothetical protein